MSGDTVKYPFVAIHGADTAKKAIMALAVEPGIRTVLICGPPGSAKSILAKSSDEAIGGKTINIPPNISDGDLFGSIDVEESIKTGRTVPKKGLLSAADGNMAVVDDIDTMDRKTLYQLLNSINERRINVEREGISISYPCDTVLVATVGHNHNSLPPHILDRFGVCAYMPENGNTHSKIKILKSMKEYSDNPKKFINSYHAEKTALTESVQKAKETLPAVKVADDMLDLIVEIGTGLGVEGHRGDIVLNMLSKALASLSGRYEVTSKDVETAASMCLIHRINGIPFEPEEEVSEEHEPCEDESRQDEKQSEGHDEQTPETDSEDIRNDSATPPVSSEDVVFEVGKQFRTIDFLQTGLERLEKADTDKGKRKRAISTDGSGRYTRNEIPKDGISDLALDATIRAAAPYQKYRDRGSMAISIEKQDIRTKIREKRTGATIMFVVDASGSLGVKNRMEAVKGAILSMLKDSYVRRDKVGMMAFRRSSTEIILQPTQSAEYGYRKLKDLPTGGKTPLAGAIGFSAEYMINYAESHIGEKCHIVLITDGRGNVSMKEGGDANEDALDMAEKVFHPRVEWIVVDATTGYARFNNAKNLSSKLGAAYFSIENLNADKLAGRVRTIVES